MEYIDDKNINNEPTASELAKQFMHETHRKSPISFINRRKLEFIISGAPHRIKCTLKTFCEYLRNKSQNLAEEEKAWIIFRWIGLNIDFDTKDWYNGKKIDSSAEGTFSKGKSVCSGYSTLYQYIAIALGLKAFCIRGEAKELEYHNEGYRNEILHEWNAVKLHGIWYLLDVTWGSGGIRNKEYIREYTPFYFCTDPKRFIRSHFPDDPKWQLLSQTVSIIEFSSLLCYSESFYDCGLSSTKPNECVLTGSKTGQYIIEYDSRKPVIIAGQLEYIEENNREKVDGGIFIQKYVNHFELNVSFNKRGKYVATFYAKLKGMENYRDRKSVV